jgi:membrane-bound ClpP family serine protease
VKFGILVIMRWFGIQNNTDYSCLIGKIAITSTLLDPSGIIEVDNEAYDAQTDGEQVEAGRGVLITRIKRHKLIVKRV